MDYAVELPEADGYKHVLIVVDRLTKEVELCKMRTLETQELVTSFLERIVARHGFPQSIVSDRGAQFASTFWRALCARAGVQIRMSTAYQPQTDGQSERAVQTMKDVLRKMISAQPARERSDKDWLRWLPLCQLATNSRVSDTTGLAPFFLTHGSTPRLGNDVEPPTAVTGPIALQNAAKVLHDRLKTAWDWANAAIAVANDAQERQANKGRRAAPAYKEGDKVWLTLRDRGMEKLGPRNAKYTITKVRGSHNYELDTPPGTHNIFHVSRLRPAGNDPHNSQRIYELQPPPVFDDGPDDVEFELDFISKQRWKGKQPQVQVHWRGYDQPSWEPRREFLGTTALNNWIADHPPTGKLSKWHSKQKKPDLPEFFSHEQEADTTDGTGEDEGGKDAV
jgi:hypothetical protein